MRWYSIWKMAARPDLSVLSGIPYSLIGGGAMSAHGLRQGQDIDLLMTSDVAEGAMEALGDAGWFVQRTPGGFHAMLGPVSMDVLTENAPILASIGREGVSEAVASSANHVLSKPWLLLMKAIASRDKDLPDFSLLTGGMADFEVEEALGLARAYAPWIADIIESEIEMAREGFSWSPMPA